MKLGGLCLNIALPLEYWFKRWFKHLVVKQKMTVFYHVISCLIVVQYNKALL